VQSTAREYRDKLTADALEEAGWSQDEIKAMLMAGNMDKEEVTTVLSIGSRWRVVAITEPSYNMAFSQLTPENPWTLNLSITNNGNEKYSAPKTVMIMFPKDTPEFIKSAPEPVAP
jgi:hypothetical protein